MGPGVGFFQTYIHISALFSTLQLDVIQLIGQLKLSSNESRNEQCPLQHCVFQETPVICQGIRGFSESKALEQQEGQNKEKAGSRTANGRRIERRREVYKADEASRAVGDGEHELLLSTFAIHRSP